MNANDLTDDEFADLSAASALHALTPEEQARFDAARASDAGRDRHAALDEQTAAQLAEIAAPVTPPPAIRDALLARIAQDASSGAAPTQPDARDQSAPADELAPAETPAVARRPRPKRAWFALAASVALIAGLGIGALTVGPTLLRSPEVAAVEQITAAPDAASADGTVTGGGTATVYWSAGESSAGLVAEDLAALEAGQIYELWFVREDGAVSAGTFRPSEDGSATAVLTGEYREGDAIAVTVEQEGGSPSGQPTTDPILVITT